MNAHTTRNRWLWLAPLALAFALLGILLVLLPANAQGSIRYVATTGADSGNCSDSGSPCLTIAYAIGQADPGDTIQIAAGTYIENLTVNEALTFIGAGADATFIDGGGTGRVIYATASIVVADLTVQNGVAFGADFEQFGGGIALNDYQQLTLTNVRVLSNTAAADGGGVYVLGQALVTGSEFRNNACSGGSACYGGGLAVSGGQLTTLADTTFVSNTASGGGGGGVYASASPGTPVSLSGGLFQDNACLGLYCQGGGLLIYDSLVLTGTRFVNNVANQGGGVSHLGTANARMVNALFARNRAGTGAAIFLSYSKMDILYTTIVSPTVGAQEAIYVESTNPLTASLNITNTIVASYTTGIKRVGSATVNSDYNLFFNAPTAVVTGSHSITGTDPLFVDPGADAYRLPIASAAVDAGVDLGVQVDIDGVTRPQIDGFDMGAYETRGPDPTCFATLDGTTVYSTTNASAVQQAVDAATGGALVKVAGICVGVQVRSGFTQTVDVAKALTLQGGYTVTNWTTTYPITQPTTLDAADGGRVISATAPLAVTDLTLQNGAAADYGGGIRTNSALTLTNVTVYSNTAQIGGGVYAEGATVYAASMVITGSRVLSNTASNGMGGGLMFYGRLTIADSRFDGNRAIWGGGGGIYATGPITLTGVEFTNNSAAQSGTSGGAVNAVSGPATNIIAAMTNVTVTGNTAVETAGGVLLDGYARATLVGGRFEANRCTDNGCIGGGLTLANDTPASLTATQFISNEAGYQGGGLATSDAITITQGYFERNRLRQSDGMGGGLSVGGNTVLASVSDTHFLSNTAGTGGGVRFFGPAQLTGGAFAGNTGGAVYAARDLTIAPTLPYTYNGDFTLEGSLAATGDLTFTAGTVTFLNSSPTHYLTNAAPTAFDRLNVFAQSGVSVLDVGTSVVTVTNVFTNAGVIHRLAPTQTVALDETYIYTDGVGQPTVLLRQTGGAVMGDTSVRVSARLATNNFVCNGNVLGPQAVRRYFDINSGGDDTNVTTDLTLRYYAPASPFYTEANNTTPDTLVIYHCDGTRWVALTGSYTRGVEGDYRWVKLSGYTFTSFSPFALGDPPSTDANLADLTLNSGSISLTPTFDWATVEYTASVANNISSVWATPTVSDTGKATAEVNGVAVESGSASSQIPLIVGETVITATGIAQDGVTTKTYTVTVTRAPSSNAELASLALSSGPLTPSFDPSVTAYTAAAPYTPAAISVTATTSDTTASFTISGTLAISGTATPVTLTVGANVITVTVIAQDNVTTIDYVVTVTRAPPAADARLAGLELAPGVLTPAFISTTASYTAAVSNLVTSVVVTPTANETNASITVNGAAHTSGAPYTLTSLAVGPNVLSATVTAEDGTTQQTYVITVTRLGADGDWYVDPVGDNANYCHAPGVGYACQTIAGAMNKAVGGDRIFIASATYTESLVVTKSLQFIGVGGPLVSGGGTNRVFSVTAGVDVTMDGLTVTRGWLGNTGSVATAAGAGIYNSGNLTLTTTVITNNVASSSFAGMGGGGIYNAAPGVLRLYASSVISNSGMYGSGLFVAGGAMTLDRSTVLSNVVTSNGASGAGLYMGGAATVVTVTNSSAIAGNRNVGTNHVNYGGGVYVAAGTLKVISSTVANNVAEVGGGGIYVVAGAKVDVSSSTIFSNTIDYVHSSATGAGIYSMGAVTITNSTVTYNLTAGKGGGLYQFGNGLLVLSSTIAYNSAGSYGGGGIYLDGSSAAQATIGASVVATNTATEKGGGVYAAALVTLTVTGGSIYNNTSGADGGGLYAAGALNLTDTNMYGNQANGGKGGGVYAGGAATLTGGAIYLNSSVRGGGGVYAAQTVNLSNVDVLTNTTTNDGPSNIGDGGGVYAGGAATLTGGRVQNNQCTHLTCAGGGVYLDYTGSLVTTDTQFLENRAGGGGGGALNLSGISTLTGVQIISNTATAKDDGYGGSGAGIKASAALTLTNATVLSNAGNMEGGGLYVDAATVITGGSYQGNRCNHALCSGGAVYVSGPLTLRNAVVANNQSGANGGGVAVFGVATVVDAILSGNTAATGQGGGLTVGGSANSLVMTNTQVLSNTSSTTGGGVYADDTARITGGRFQNNACTGAGCTGGGLYVYRAAMIDSVRFSSNAATGSGGALYLNNQGGSAQQIVNTLLDGNRAPQGAGLYDNKGGTTILLTTVASPTVGAGSAIQIAAGTVAITDSIVANYTTGIAASGTGALRGDYNLVYNAPTTLDTGPHSLTDDPRFRDPAVGNYRLLAGSPAVGAGAHVSVTTDIDGAPRPQGSGYDLGAHQVNLVWYVDPAGSDGNTCFFPGAANACKTITGALGKAQIGSTIYITTGVYTERLTVTVPIHFIGTGADAAAVVVDGSGAGRVFNVTASDATFSGITIQNGAADSGAGIRATGNLSMTNVAVLTNTAASGDGGGIFAGSALTLTNVEARANTASGNGGGIYASVAPSLTDVSLLANQAQNGGGLYTPDASVLTGGLYRGNQATTAGGGIYAAGALTVTGASVLNNTATGSGGGIYAAGAVSVTSASVLNNTATGNGGGLYALGPVTVTATTVTGNAASENGGGLYAPAGAAVNGGLFQDNVAANAAAADGGGGGLYTLAPTTIVDAQFISNTVSGEGGGGGAYISATLTLTNVQFLNNTVTLTSTTGGGGVYAVGDMRVVGGLFQGNACAGDGCQGGALFTSGALTLTGARVVDNQAAGEGGGVVATGDVVISGGVIQQNRSTSSTGGGVASTSGALTLTNTDVLSNTALGNGGGAYALFGDVTINGGRIQGNACTDTACKGGGVYVTNTLWLSGTQVIDNAADGTGGGANAWDTTVIDARFQGNQCTGAGCSCGGLAIFGTMAVTGAQFIANTADYYGGLCQSAATGGSVVNTLFARNTGRTNFDVAYFDSGEPVEILYTTVASPTIGANAAIVVSGTVNITNSIVASYTTGIAVASGLLTSDYNLFYNAPMSAITGSHSLTGVNPLFFDMAADNYRLASASPAIGAALDLGIATDLDGTARPQLGSFDIGAFEYNACGVTNVNDSGPGSLRDNIAACPEVVFDAGFFATPRTIQLNSQLTITRNVTVDGARYNIYTPTIQAPLAGGRVFTVAAGVDATLNRLAITGGRLSGATEATGAGAGIFNVGALTVTNSIVTNNVVTDTIWGRGAGVYNATGGVLTLVATTLFSNTAAAGGGLYVNGGAVTLDNALISTNLVTYTTSQAGGGVYVAGGLLTVTNGSVITNNLAYTATTSGISYGGGIYAAQVGALRLISGTIANNTANRGGGLYIASAGELDLANVTVAGNRASLDTNNTPGNGNGGGIYATGALSLTGGVLRENVARISGGGLYASDWLTVTAVQFISNTAQSTQSPSDDGGGGAYAVMTATVISALFQGNAAEYVGGGLRAQQAATIAESNFFSNTAVNETGAAHIIGAAVVTGTTFSGNRAQANGALQVSEDAAISNSLFQYNAASSAGGEAGGARIFGTARLTNVQFISNTAGYAGALLLNGGQAGWLTNTRFISNTARARGGAVEAYGPLTIDSSHFEANQAWGAQGQGGALYVGSTTVVTVTASTFLTNTATEYGGALADADGGGSDWVMRDSRFQGNAGGYAGAAAIGTGGSVSLDNSDFVGNRTTNAGNGNGGAVFVNGPVVVVDSLFEANVALKGAGALQTRGSTQITGTTFSANQAEDSGAVYIQYASSQVMITNSFFLSNTATTGAAGALQTDGSTEIRSVQFISNTSKVRSGALTAGSTATTTLTIDASRFEYNTTGGEGGALSALNSGVVTITATSFVSNTAATGGGALDVGDLVLVSGLFQANRTTAVSAHGGAVKVANSAYITSATFFSNTSTASGGALYGASGANVAIAASRFQSNTAASHGGGVAVIAAAVITDTDFISNTANYGGALSGAGAASVITVTDSLFQLNQSDRGGAVAVFGRGMIVGARMSDNMASLGGAAYVDGGTAIFSSTQIVSNTASAGGGIYGNGRVTLAAVDLQQNRCTGLLCVDSGLFSNPILTVTADAPYTYLDNLDLRGDLVALGNVTFTANLATFSPDPSTVTTHTLTGTATTTFHDLAVLNLSVLDVGSSVITATGVTTNAGVIHRLAPAQAIIAAGPARTYDDGVGKPTAVLAQSAGTAMGDTTVRVSANLTTTAFLCNGRVISPQAARRYYVITPTNGAGVTADLTLYYYNGAAHSEANGLNGTDLRIFHCDGTRWKVVGDAADYTTGTDGDYVWAKVANQYFASFSPFIIGAVPLTNTNLINLQVFSSSVEIPLSPSFAAATTSYTATVANEVVSVTVKPTITQTFATVEVNGVEVISGSHSSLIPLVIGPNVITTVVYAQDGVTTQTYTVTITRASTARLSDLALSAGPLNPAFITTTQAYTLATVSFPVASTLVTVAAEYAGDAIAVTAGLRGTAAAPCTGAASPWTCPLAVGTNVVSVTVTAADATTRVYTVTVPRAGDATLSNLELSAAPINPAFVSTTLAYITAVLSNATASTLVTPTLTYAASDVLTVTAAANGGAGAACSGAPYTCPLAVGVNVISVTVTAIDNTTQVYTVTVPRASEARLSDLAVAPGGNPAPLYPTFSPATQGYTMTVVSYDAITASVAATAAVSSDLVGVVVAPTGGAEATCTGAAPWTCPLAVGENTISVTVTAADNSMRVYTVTLTRAGDATLSTLAVSAGPLTPAYISTTLAYTTPAVAKAVASTLVTATSTYASDQFSITVARSGGAESACTGAAAPWSCPLRVGFNVVSVTVTAVDDTTQVYTVTVQRLPSDNADLASLDVRNVTLTPVFDPATTSYTSSVPSYIVRVVITPTTVDPDATIAVSGTAVISGTASPTYTLAYGDNVIIAIGTAENGIVTKTYTVTLTRAAPVSPWYVQPDGDNTNPCTAFGTETACQTIAGAMAKAVSGDTIYIARATYTESLTVNKSLTFIGVNTPTVSGGGMQRVFSITAGVDVTMDGLIVAGGYLTGADLTTSAGAGIYNAGNLTVTNSSLTGNQATHFDWGQGGALFVAATGTARVIDSTIVSNTATYGGGIVSRGGAVLVDHTLVASNLVTGYVASSGGGIYMTSGAVTITNGSQIVENRAAMAGSEGGGIRSAGGQLLVSDSAILSNTAIKGGGASINGGIATLDVALVAGNFVTNSTQAMGGGLYIQGVSTVVTVTRSTVDANRVFGGTSLNSGGGIFVNSGVLRLIDSTLTGNIAYNYGGGLYIDFGAGHLITGTIFAANTANMGGALAVRSSDPLAIYNTIVYSNSAVSGSGGGVYANPPLTLVGGAIYSNTSNSNGAGVYAGAALTMTNVTVRDNLATVSSNGAGVFARDTATVSGSQFANNRCTGACYGAGLYMYTPGAPLTLVDTQFISNTATVRGGGLYAKGPVSMSGGEFRGNSAGSAPTSGGLFAEQVLTITASAPFTYLDGFELLGDLAVSDNLTLTTGVVSFVVDPSAPTTVVTHTLRSAATTSFNYMAVVDYAVLDVGSSDVRVTGVFTNAGVINRLAPIQTITAPNTPYTFVDGVGLATAVVTQTGGAAMGDTTVRVSAHLTSSQVTCNGAQPPYGAIRRIFTVTPANGAGVTADLTFAYFDGALNSERNALDPASLVVYRCGAGGWQSPDGAYTTGAAGSYRTVTLDGYTFDGFGLFAIGAPPSRNADLIDLVLNGATVTPTLTPDFATDVFVYTTTVASDVFTVTARPTVSDTTAIVRVNGAVVISGSTSSPIPLVVGSTVITTLVTAQDSLTTRTYTVTVTRLPNCMATPDNGTTEFKSLDSSAVQQAVDAAAPGATVKVAGVCRGVEVREAETQTVYISQTLTVVGGYSFTGWTASYPITQPTTLDAESSGRVVFATAPLTVANLIVQNGSGDTYGGGISTNADLTLRGVTLVSNTVTSNLGGWGGGAVFVNGGDLRVDDSYFGANQAVAGANTDADGGAVWVDGNLTISNTQFVNNTAANDDGAIEVLTGTVQIDNSHFSGNQALDGNYGVLEAEDGSVRIAGSTFMGNSATDEVGAVFAFGDTTIVGTSFLSNTAGTDDGAVYVEGAATVSGDSLFQGNAAGDDAGAIEVFGALVIADTEFVGNTALGTPDGSYAGAVYGQDDVAISGSTFQGNGSSAGYAGALRVKGALVITGSEFISNTASGDDGAIYARTGVTLTGSLFQGNAAGDDVGALEADGALVITDSNFISNTAVGDTGAVHGQIEVTISASLFQGNAAGADEGVLEAVGALVITNSEFRDNTAVGYAGAVYGQDDVTISGSTFQGNGSSAAYAGALRVKGALVITGSNFISNTASAEDGAIYAAGDVAVDNSRFQGNQAGAYAGALELGGALTVTGAQFIGNSSGGSNGSGIGAGAVYADGGAVTLVDSLFQENQALNGFDVGALYAYDVIVTITNTGFLSNTASNLYGAVRSAASAGSPELRISDSLFQGNVAGSNAGALGADNLLIVRDSRFSANRSTNIAGAIWLDGAGDLQNVLFDRNNTAGAPGAALFVNSAPSLQIVHITIASPTVGAGAAIYVNAGAVAITDTIVASYTAGIQNGGGTVVADYNFLYNAPTTIDVGSHSITGIDPRFVDAAAGNYRLQPGLSYAADTGVDVGVTTDLDGTARPQGYGFSMGAYEAAGPILPCNATPDDGATLFATFYGDAVQQAVDVAAPGATVKVAGVCTGVQPRGGYTQTVYLSQTLTVAGGYTLTNWTTSYPITQPTTLDAQGGGRVIYATTALTVSGLTVQNGRATGSDPACTGAGCGGGVFADGALLLREVQVLSNTATHGGGVHGNNTVTVVGSRFEHNTATENGGGLRSVQAGTVTDTAFISNTAATAGGALFDSASTVSNSSFAENATTTTGSAGGGFFNGIAALTNVTFTLNTAGSGGGGGAVFGNSATVSGGAFVSNTAAFAGGGAYFNGAATLVGTEFTGNRATANRGGGAYFNGTATLSNTTFTGNAVANDRGGGAYFRDAATVTGGGFENNLALNRGGGAYFNAAAALMDTAFLSNTGVTRAGGAYIGGSATVSGGRFQGNQCVGNCLGGGLFVSDTLTLTGAQFLDNWTDGLGGGLLTQSNTEISNTIFADNFAELGGGGWSQAGGEQGRVVNSLFAANRAGSGLGNALGLSLTVGSGAVEVLYTTIASPTVGAGSAVYVAAGVVNITNTIVASYTAGIETVAGVVTSDYNLFYNAPTTVITGSHSIEGRDPRFADPASGDYHLAAGSAAIDTAVDVGITNDLAGALRPQADGYDIGAYESPLSSNADLASLTPSDGALTPPFAAATTRYTVTVAYGVASITLTPTTVDPNATIAMNQAPVLSGTASAPIPLVVGENIITTTVTAQNGIKTKDYIVVVIRASLAALGGLEIYPGTLAPAFISTTLAYTAQVTNGDPGVLITPTAGAGDVITVTVSQNGGAPIPCGGAELACPLVVGVNVISVTVTAADGTTQTYTITVTRPSEARLLGLEINPGTLTPSFISTTLDYTAAVGNPVASTHVTVTASPGDVISVTVTPSGGAEVACTGAPVTCPLAVGENAIAVTVTAADNATYTYVVAVMRAPATDAALIALELSAGTLTPVFATETTAYAATVANIVDSVIMTPTASEPNATITVNGAPVASATGSAPIPLNFGANPITTTVTAQDGVTKRDYIVIVTRPAIAVTAVNDAAGMVQGGVITVAPLANDPDPVGGGLLIVSVGQPAHGAAVIEAGAQSVTYTPDPAFSGVDFFVYVAQDANGSTDSGIVTVIVAAQSQTDDAPQIGVVDNQNGATLDFLDHGFQVSVQMPAGSYTGMMGPKDIFYLVYTVIMTPTGDVNQAPNGLRFGNIVFDLSAFFNYDLLPGYRFPTPITLELTYDPAMLDGLSEPTLELFYWDGAAWSSEGITFLARDTVNHTLTIALAHLSELAVFGSAPTALEPTPEPGLVIPRLYLPVVTHAAGAVAEQAAPVDAPLTPEDAPLAVPLEPEAVPLEPEATPPAAEDVPAEESVPDVPETLTTPEAPLPIQVLLPIITR